MRALHTSWPICAEDCLTCRHERPEESIHVKHRWQLGQLQVKQSPMFNSVPLHCCLLKALNHQIDSMQIKLLCSGLYLGAFSAYSVRVQDKVCKLFCPVAHVQAPVLPLWILVLEVLQLLYNPNVADKLLNYLKGQWDLCARLWLQCKGAA